MKLGVLFEPTVVALGAAVLVDQLDLVEEGAQAPASFEQVAIGTAWGNISRSVSPAAVDAIDSDVSLLATQVTRFSQQFQALVVGDLPCEAAITCPLSILLDVVILPLGQTV